VPLDGKLKFSSGLCFFLIYAGEIDLHTIADARPNFVPVPTANGDVARRYTGGNGHAGISRDGALNLLIAVAIRRRMARVGQAIRRVPGRVLVVGHTDDQPIQSIRFQDNFALSRARAERVATLLRQDVDVAARVQSNGVGSTQPRYRPESSQENRARNRRVEIVHVSGS